MAKGLVSGGKKEDSLRAKQGDVIAIKIRPKTFVLAKVAYVSEYHRGVLFFRVYNEVFRRPKRPRSSGRVPRPVPVLCSLHPIRKMAGGWP